MMDKIMTKIRAIDMSVWAVVDKTNSQTSLTSLRMEIDNYLNVQPVEAVAAIATKKTLNELA